MNLPLSLHVLLADALCVGVVLGVFFTCRALFLRTRIALLHPILWSTVAVWALWMMSGQSRQEFRAETDGLVWLLGPAVVALAVPVWRRRALITANWRSLLLVVLLGVGVSAGSMLLLAPAFGWEVGRSLATKSVTAPVALGVAREAGLSEGLVAIGVMCSGLLGAVLGPTVLRWAGTAGDTPAAGLALGCVSHGVGTARALELGPTAGAFASVAMSLTAVASALILPALLRWLG